MRMLLAIAMTLLMVGCSILHSVGGTEDLRRVAYRCWLAKQRGRWDEFYDRCLCPSYKKIVPRDRFIATANLKVESFEVTRVEPDPSGEKAVVEVKFDTRVMGFYFKGITVREKWFKVEGKWCHMPEKRRGLFEKKGINTGS